MAKEIAPLNVLIGKKLGSGAFGCVSAALTRWSLNRYVLKEPLDGDQEDLQYECEVLKNIGWHSGITSLHYFYNTGHRIGLLFERGVCSLADLSDEHFFLESEIRGIYVDIRSALAFVHVKGYVHLDVKPDNIIVYQDGSVKLADFGIATKLDENGNLKSCCWGTYPYMAPEILRRDAVVSCTVDFWSLAVTCLEVFHNCLPFAGQNPQTILHNIINRKFFGDAQTPLDWQDWETSNYFLEKLQIKPPLRQPQASYLQDTYFQKPRTNLFRLIKNNFKTNVQLKRTATGDASTVTGKRLKL